MLGVTSAFAGLWEGPEPSGRLLEGRCSLRGPGQIVSGGSLLSIVTLLEYPFLHWGGALCARREVAESMKVATSGWRPEQPHRRGTPRSRRKIQSPRSSWARSMGTGDSVHLQVGLCA